MTPETKNPTRAEALSCLLKLKHRKHKLTLDEALFLLVNYGETIEAALATDAPIVEGEFERIASDARSYAGNFLKHEDYKQREADIVAVRNALYAQGRTQSAVPDGWKLVPIEPTEEMLIAARPKHLQSISVERAWGTALREDYKNLLSAAPPVTGGAWIKVDPDNIYQGYFAWLDEDSDDQEPMVCAWPPMDKYAKCFKRGYYCPLPTPPSAQTRGG